MDCIFCKILNGELPCSKLYEDNTTIAIMDRTTLTDTFLSFRRSTLKIFLTATVIRFTT